MRLPQLLGFPTMSSRRKVFGTVDADWVPLCEAGGPWRGRAAVLPADAALASRAAATAAAAAEAGGPDVKPGGGRVSRVLWLRRNHVMHAGPVSGKCSKRAILKQVNSSAVVEHPALPRAAARHSPFPIRAQTAWQQGIRRLWKKATRSHAGCLDV